MAQSANPDDTYPLDHQSDDSLTSNVSHVQDQLEHIEESGVSVLSNTRLVELRDSLKTLEDTLERVRKEAVDSEIKDRIEPGESLLGLQHVESHNKYVEEDTSTIIMRAVAHGIDYTEFVDVNASTLSDVAPEIAEIGQRDYTYLR